MFTPNYQTDKFDIDPVSFQALGGTEKFMVLMFSQIMEKVCNLQNNLQDLNNQISRIKESNKEQIASIKSDLDYAGRENRDRILKFIEAEFIYLKRKQPIKKTKKK